MRSTGKTKGKTTGGPEALGRRLLAWYDRHRRDLPWRAAPGERNDPYRVWLSEIMLQQTTVTAVIPYYLRFLASFPTVRDLAAAECDDVLRLWAGLGYYARARNLHACAHAVIERHGGCFPQTPEELRTLPGIGDYTAAAVAAIAFDAPAVPVDGNVERVVARLFAIDQALPAGKPTVRRAAHSLAPGQRAGDFAQGLMDLGATVCTPKSPSCGRCPLHTQCAARKSGAPEAFPVKSAKRPGHLRRGAAFVALRADGSVLVRTRPAKGLLGGMTEVPTTDWTHDFDARNALDHAPVFCASSFICGRRARPSRRRRAANGEIPTIEPGEDSTMRWRRVRGTVSHVFTHFPLELAVFLARVPKGTDAPEGTRWVACEQLGDEALPNLMLKVIAAAGLRELNRELPAPQRAARRSR